MLNLIFPILTLASMGPAFSNQVIDLLCFQMFLNPLIQMWSHRAFYGNGQGSSSTHSPNRARQSFLLLTLTPT